MSTEQDNHRFETTVDGLVDQGRLRWAELECDEEGLRTFIGERLQEDAVLDGAELRLAWACCTGSSAAIKIFEGHYLAKARLALQKLHLQEEQVEDVLAKVTERLLVGPHGENARLLGYAGLGRLEGLVIVSATREALSVLRKRGESQLDDHSPRLAASGDPQRELLKSELTKEMRSSFELAARSLTPRERNLLRLHFVDRLSIDEIGAMHRVHRATAARWLAGARDELTRRSRDAATSALALEGVEIGEVLDLIESRLSLSLSRVLRTTAE